jgi:hypothetical protein
MLERPVSHRDVLHSVLSDYHRLHSLESFPVQVDDLRPLIEGKGIAKKIEWYEVTFYNRYLASSIQIYEKQGDLLAQINIAKNMDYYWQRIALCKEMYHCMIDSSQRLRVKTIDELVSLTDGLTSEFSHSLLKAMKPAKSALDTESEAMFLAIETLVPFEVRQQILEPYWAGKLSPTRMAAFFVVPEYYIPKIMDRDYMAGVKTLRGSSLVPIRR